MTTTLDSRDYFVSPTGRIVGTQAYYAEAIDAGYFGVADVTGRAFRPSTSNVADEPADESHLLTVFNAVDVPNAVAEKIAALLKPYDVDVYTRACDATGHAL